MSSPATAARNRRLYFAAVLSALAAGFAVRGWGVLPVPLAFWADEAWWATLLQSGEFVNFGFRPAGYMWLCRQLLAFGNPELLLRLPSLAAGCAALVCLWRGAQLSTRTCAAALFVLLLAAFHPKLVVFSKEFKPYAVEVFVYCALTLWTLGCLRRDWSRAGLIGAALLALPFCYPVVFLYPGIAIALAGERMARLRMLSARQWVWALAVLVPVVVFVHLQLFERFDAGSSRVLWGSKYDVFPLEIGFLGGVAWYALKTWSLVTLAGALDGVPQFGLALFGMGFAGGVVILAHARRFAELALLAGPLVMALAANLLGYWPYGAFRANLFLIPGILLVTAQSVDWLASGRNARWIAYALLAAIPLAVAAGGLGGFRSKLSRHWSAAPQLTEVIADIDRRRQSGDPDSAGVILADWHSWRPILFYLPRTPALRDRTRLVRGPVADLGALESKLGAEIGLAARERRPTRLWLVVTRLDAHAAIRESELVRRHVVYQREFATGDPDYHPLLIELQIDAPADLLASAARRYHPRPRAIRAS